MLLAVAVVGWPLDAVDLYFHLLMNDGLAFWYVWELGPTIIGAAVVFALTTVFVACFAGPRRHKANARLTARAADQKFSLYLSLVQSLTHCCCAAGISMVMRYRRCAVAPPTWG